MNYRLGLLSIGLMMLSGCDWFDISTTKSTSLFKIIVVNVLSPELYADAHIKGSINAPFEKLTEIAKTWDRKVPVVLYCSNYLCTASKQGVSMLKELGFESVRAYEGGTAEWYQLSKADPSYQIIGPAQQKYLSLELSAPAEIDETIMITASELKNMIKEATIAE